MTLTLPNLSRASEAQEAAKLRAGKILKGDSETEPEEPAQAPFTNP